MFVLDFLPEKYLKGGKKDSIAIFTAGWAMKFVPLLGKALADMALHGKSKSRLKEFWITRKNPQEPHQGIIIEDTADYEAAQQSSFAFVKQAVGSSVRGLHNTGR